MAHWHCSQKPKTSKQKATVFRAAIEGLMRSMFPESKGPLSKIPRTGPAPVLMRAVEWLRVVPAWERLTAHIEGDDQIKDVLGWVREMYAFSIAAALEVLTHSLIVAASLLCT
jgi:hypothetical protein